jgi:hypothetical protein
MKVFLFFFLAVTISLYSMDNDTIQVVKGVDQIEAMGKEQINATTWRVTKITKYVGRRDFFTSSYMEERLEGGSFVRYPSPGVSWSAVQTLEDVIKIHENEDLK